MVTLLMGDCREVIKTLPDRSVQCCVTSPPYFGLRRYDVDGVQIGMEPTPGAYMATLVEVFREVRRVLRDDGTVWLNLGDSYGRGTRPSWHGDRRRGAKDREAWGNDNYGQGVELPEKNLIGIPWRVAFALQDDGWVLRSDIIWSKPNCMPESVRDRPTRSHEYVFLLAKQARYFYDADAIREPHTRLWNPETNGGSWAHPEKHPRGSKAGHHGGAYPQPNPAGRNRRTVWSIPTAPYAGAHFATFPEDLIEPMILAGSSPRACDVCGAPWERVVEREAGTVNLAEGERQQRRSAGAQTGGTQKVTLGVTEHVRMREIGWRPTCQCEAAGTGRCVILDPFVGSGTTCRVAERLQRDSIGIDLGYADLQEQRTDGVQTMMGELL